ncbi:MAG: UDP-glucose/GDP-mannose dehydrogenase, partial [Devosia sp.]|nr:UDP-glucose/GDP-mannose dehydrogenase [Devosia sp.]
HFNNDSSEAARNAAAVFLAVGTPSDESGDIDLSFVEAAAIGISRHLKNGAVLILKSTVVAGTAGRVKNLVDSSRGRKDVSVASNPEFLREGSAIKDFLRADRIVVGADDRRSEEILREIYRPLTATGVPLVVTKTVNAELIKYAANALLALKIGFINDVADLCEKLDGDVVAVADGIGRDRRIGAAFLAAGPGFGGSCFPKDTRAFAITGRRHGAPQPLVEALIERNEARKQSLARRIIDATPRGGRVAVLGTSFKANTDDVREAASLTIVPLLVEAGLNVHAHDPQPRLARRLLTDVQWHDTALQAARHADVVVILTEWDDYRSLDPAQLAAAMRGRTVFDFRNILEGARAGEAGLHYFGLGRAAIRPEKTRRGQGTAATVPLAASPA